MAEYLNKEEYCKNYCRCNSEYCDRRSCPVWKAPAADVEPVRACAHWIEQAKYSFGTMYDCSICSTRILDNGHSWHYCPNCGAKMNDSK